MNLTHHIRAATGNEPLHEPAASRGDLAVGMFCAGLAVGFVLGLIGKLAGF